MKYLKFHSHFPWSTELIMPYIIKWSQLIFLCDMIGVSNYGMHGQCFCNNLDVLVLIWWTFSSVFSCRFIGFHYPESVIVVSPSLMTGDTNVDWISAHCTLHPVLHCVSLDQYIDGLVQDCSNSSALALELLQSCTKPSACIQFNHCGTRFSSGKKKICLYFVLFLKIEVS